MWSGCEEERCGEHSLRVNVDLVHEEVTELAHTTSIVRSCKEDLAQVANSCCICFERKADPLWVVGSHRYLFEAVLIDDLDVDCGGVVDDKENIVGYQGKEEAKNLVLVDIINVRGVFVML